MQALRYAKCMALFTIFFTFGVWLLQQRATLPDFIWAWLLTAYPIALTMSPKTFTGRAIRMLLLAALACGSGFYYAAWQAQQRLSISLPDQWQGRDIDVTGVVAELPHRSERGQRFNFTVEKMLTPGVNVPRHIYLSTYTNPRNKSPVVHAGERWQLTVRLKQPHGSSNPHGYDFELWALENNVRAVGYVNNKGNNSRLSRLADGNAYRIESWREAIRDKISNTLGSAPYTGIITALTIGDQESISQAQWQLFRRTGVIHLMSISGLHITMQAGIAFTIVYWLWRRSYRLTLWLPARKAAAVAAVLTAYAYTLLAGYGVPAQRTVYMVLAAATALWFNRNFSLSQILSIAVLCVLILDPWAVLSPGFCLSFGAVALILYTTSHRISQSQAGQNTQERANPPRQIILRLREYATVQWAMSIGLVPLLLAFFWQLPLISPLSNAIAIPMVSLLVVPLSLLGALLPSEVPLWLAHIALELTMLPLHYLNNLPHAVWIQHAPAPWSIIAGMLGVLWILTPRGFPVRYFGGLLLLPMFLNAPNPPSVGSLKMTIFDVGQGLSVAIQTRQHLLLYDTGPDFSGETDSGNRILVPALHAMGIISLDGLILSHDDIDHTGGTDSVLQEMPTAWLSSSQTLTTVKTYTGKLRYCRDGVSWNWDGVSFEFLHPGKESFTTGGKLHNNDLSCVLRIGTGNQHILLTGDIEKRAGQRLLKLHAEQLAATLLIAPHHGSSSSSEVDFIAAVLPDFVVFTSGYRNRFGHPREVIRQRYQDSGATLLRSDFDGAILADMNPQGLTIARYRLTHQRYWTHMPAPD